MNFSEAEKYLLSLGNEVSTMKLGLESITKLLDALDRPHEKYLKVQVAGTNGKGSVCAFLDSISNTAGIQTGTFTSPHLISITERVRINGSNIAENAFARHATVVRETSERLIASGELSSIPTFFEQITAIALLSFADAGVELAILETGLGGRLDATTAANAEIAVITRIDLDHQEYLGETMEGIAREKAAIIRNDSITVIGEQSSEANKVILERWNTLGVEPRFADFVDLRTFDDRIVLVTDLCDYEIDGLGLSGRHQIGNAKVALLVAEELARRFSFLKADIILGLQNARHPGRLEYQGRYLFDGAHNVGGAKALVEFLDEFETRPITLLFGVMQGKDAREMLTTLTPHAQRVVLTEPTNSRALPLDELLEMVPDASEVNSSATVDDAVTLAEALTSADGIILVTGSLYLVGEIKKLLRYRGAI